jgi:UDP-glucose 4-epimerase
VAAKQWLIDLVDADAPVALASACEGADAILHLAGANEVAATKDPEGTVADTIRLTHRIAAAAVAAGIRRVVYVSTVHVYGARLAPGAVITEDLRPEPRHPYAIARLASEHVLASVASDPVILRLTNSVGAPISPAVDRWSLVANDLCRQAVTTGRLRLRTAGTQWRDFIALADVCRVLDGALDPARLPSGVYNLGAGRSHRVRDLAEIVQQRMETATGQRPPLLAPPPEADPPGAYRVSTDRLRQAGWPAEGSLESAIDETLLFCLAHAGQLAAIEAG